MRQKEMKKKTAAEITNWMINFTRGLYSVSDYLSRFIYMMKRNEIFWKVAVVSNQASMGRSIWWVVKKTDNIPLIDARKTCKTSIFTHNKNSNPQRDYNGGYFRQQPEL